MKVTTYGTRGSIPVAGPNFVQFGGNTTCLQIHSNCIPPGSAFVVDAGTGFVPLSHKLWEQGVRNIRMLMTHYHTDHTLGLTMADHTHKPGATIHLWGPKEHDAGSAEMMVHNMLSPYFPVAFAQARDRFRCRSFEHIGTEVMVVHPTAGYHVLAVDTYRKALNEGRQLRLGPLRHHINECLVVWMHKTAHPEYTISYRFEEKPTGRVFVFLTDHENTDGIPGDLRRYITGATLLIQDAQYAREVYDERTAGFGHGTPDYCAKLAIACGVESLGLTHHDPNASDDDIIMRLEEAKNYLLKYSRYDIIKKTFACADYQTYDA